MQARNHDSTRILRLAAWIWIGYLLAMAATDFILYTQAKLPLAPNLPNQPFPPNPPLVPRYPLFPVYLYYAANGFVALSFLVIAYWDWIQEQLDHAFYPLLLLTISTAPIIINVLVVPRFPNGPLANAEGMALRQLPVLFIALALVAWQYQLPHVIFFSIATTGLELGLISAISINNRGPIVLLFIAIIRTISFIAVGVFISMLVTRLREQQESLRQANANLSHYASTLEQLTVSRERNRLARELHDTLAHSLTALSVTLETAKAYFDIDATKTRGLLDKSLEATRSGVDETRRALKALRSSALEDMGLGLAVKRLAESAASRFNLDLELGLQNPMPSLSPDVEQAIYRIAQESIENISHHSKATKFSVHLSNNGLTTLTIQDNGIGFDSNARTPTGHFGLVGMKERAELAGGRLTIESEKGRGTKVTLKI
ncbi:MAG: sensor histidine kinase [Chloroflexi bacterium]|nr:sensor histidine kinase [Chloroflexota bacterium]